MKDDKEEGAFSRRMVLAGAVAGLAAATTKAQAHECNPDPTTISLRASFHHVEDILPNQPTAYEGVATVGFQNGTSTFRLTGRRTAGGVIRAQGELLSGPQVGNIELVLTRGGPNHGTLRYTDAYNTSFEIPVQYGFRTGSEGPEGPGLFEIEGARGGYAHPRFEGPMNLILTMDGCGVDPAV